MSQYPPASLYPVVYNVQPGDLEEYSNLDVPETRYFLTRRRASPPSLRECDDIEASLNACVRRYLSDGGFPEFDERGEVLWGMSNVGDFLGDRTVNAALSYPAMLTPTFVKAIQQEVLARRSLWRVVFRVDSSEPENWLAVYPSAFSIGSAFYEKLDAPIAAWQQRMREWEEREYGTLMRQLRYIEAVIPALKRRLSKASFAIAGLFDNSTFDEAEHGLWLAYFAADDEDVSVKGENVAEGHRRIVDENGRLRTSSFETDEWLASDDPSAGVPAPKVRLRIRQYVLPAALEHRLTVKIRPKRKKAAIHLSADDLITDAELKLRFGA